MTENKKKAGFFTKENLFASILGAMMGNFKDWFSSEAGKLAKDKISNKVLGIGPEDEALFKKACSFLLDEILKLDVKTQVKERTEILLKITGFLKYLEGEGYSLWWLRNVLATMRKGDDDNANQAAKTLGEIIQGKDFEEMAQIAGPDLIQKTYKKQLSEGWELVVNKSGQMTMLFDGSKITNFLKSKIKSTKDECKRGFVKGLVWFWGSISVLAVIFLVFYLI